MSYHKKEKQLDIMKQVYEAGLQLLSPATKEELYPQIAKTLKVLLNSSSISIYRVYHDELVKVYTSLPELIHIYPRKSGFTYKSFKESIPYLINKKNVTTIHPELKQMGVSSTLVIPLLFEIEPIGVLSIDFEKDQNFSPYIIDTLQLFASIITFKLKNIELESQLREMVENQKTFISLASGSYFS
ncbi:MAG TPA: GAF domain-containing protein [Candidatus Woesebacteria bacterium]|nr:GAF domain-containing protein [Candidatus Woesebacteria bacterium]